MMCLSYHSGFTNLAKWMPTGWSKSGFRMWLSYMRGNVLTVQSGDQEFQAEFSGHISIPPEQLHSCLGDIPKNWCGTVNDGVLQHVFGCVFFFGFRVWKLRPDSGRVCFLRHRFSTLPSWITCSKNAACRHRASWNNMLKDFSSLDQWDGQTTKPQADSGCLAKAHGHQHSFPMVEKDSVFYCSFQRIDLDTVFSWFWLINRPFWEWTDFGQNESSTQRNLHWPIFAMAGGPETEPVLVAPLDDVMVTEWRLKLWFLRHPDIISDLFNVLLVQVCSILIPAVIVLEKERVPSHSGGMRNI